MVKTAQHGVGNIPTINDSHIIKCVRQPMQFVFLAGWRECRLSRALLSSLFGGDRRKESLFNEESPPSTDTCLAITPLLSQNWHTFFSVNLCKDKSKEEKQIVRASNIKTFWQVGDWMDESKLGTEKEMKVLQSVYRQAHHSSARQLAETLDSKKGESNTRLMNSHV